MNPYLKEISLILGILEGLKNNPRTLYSFQIFSDNSCVFRETVKDFVLYGENPRELYQLLKKEKFN